MADVELIEKYKTELKQLFNRLNNVILEVELYTSEKKADYMNITYNKKKIAGV